MLITLLQGTSMKLHRYLLLGLFLTAFAAYANPEGSEGAESRPDRDHHEDDCDCELKGDYSYWISGNFGTGLASSLSEAGSIFFNGKGQGSARGVTVLTVAGVSSFVHPTYTFTYVETAPNIFLITSTRVSETSTLPNLQFVVTKGDKCEDIALVVLPYSSAPFNVINVSGVGGK